MYFGVHVCLSRAGLHADGLLFVVEKSMEGTGSEP